MIQRQVFSLSVLGVLLVLGETALPDWPVFRGNAQQTGVAASELPGRLEVLWRFEVKGAVESTVAIAHGTVYVGSDRGILYAVSLADGKPKWQYPAGDTAFKVGVAVNGGLVYAGDEDGKFHCVDAKAGEKRWVFDTDSEITSAANFDEGRVLFGAGDQMLYCFDKDKGTKLWEFKLPGGPVMGSPAIIDSKTFVAGCDSVLHVIDTKTGKEIQSVELDGQVGATPALIGDMLYVGTMTNQIQAINWKEGKVPWSYEAKKKQQPFYASVAATRELVIGGSRDKCVHALDRKTGEAKWIFPTGGRVDSSPVVAGKRVYFGSMDGKLYVVDLATGMQVQAIELGHKGILASPAVSANRLVIGTVDGVVFCLGKKE